MDLIVDVYASFRLKAWGFFHVEKAEFSIVLSFLEFIQHARL